MAFANEWITPEDVQKFDMLKDERKVGGEYGNLKIDPRLLSSYVMTKNDIMFEEKWGTWMKHVQDFTVDRERDCYLRYGGKGYLDFYPGLTFFMLNWRGRRVYFSIRREELRESDHETKTAYDKVILEGISMPDEFKTLETEVLTLIKEALAAYGDAGMRSNYKPSQIFSF